MNRDYFAKPYQGNGRDSYDYGRIGPLSQRPAFRDGPVWAQGFAAAVVLAVGVFGITSL